MPTNAENALAFYESEIGKPAVAGEWFEVTQDQVNQFADVTKDHQFIHIDPEAAKATPFGGTIAHGFLTLSMLTHLAGTVPTDPKAYQGILMGVNYGFDKVRFVSPVKVGSKIRATSAVSAVEAKGTNDVQTVRTMTVEIEGSDRPALVAEWITRLTFG